MTTPRLHIALPLLLAATLSAAAAAPRLVIAATVEGLDPDVVEQLDTLLTDRGLRRLMRTGVTLSDVDYGRAVTDPVAATAILATGAHADATTVDAATWYDTERRLSQPVLTLEGNYTPAPLPVSTLADELKVATGGIGHAYAVAPDPRQAILLAGHAANAATWIDDVSGRWSLTTAYPETPPAVSSRNYSPGLPSRLDTLKWRPLRDPSLYPGIPSYKTAYPFRHVFPRKDVNRYRAFKASAPANSEVTALALDLIRTQSLGADDAADMLALAYTVAPFPWSKDPDSRLETLDAYLRLDADLARLFDAADAATGGNLAILVAGLPTPPSDKADDPRFHIPSGTFSTRKALSLLNMYLMAMHGNGEWVAGYHNGQVHLNRKLIAERGLDLELLRRQTAEFMVQVEGVSRAVTLGTLLLDPATAPYIAPATAGDVYLTISPGWQIEHEAETQTAPRPQVSRYAVRHYPCYIVAPGIEPCTVTATVDAAAIAPTMARLLRIRAPNGAAATPLPLK